MQTITTIGLDIAKSLGAAIEKLRNSASFPDGKLCLA
jgi:hypothetical protein